MTTLLNRLRASLTRGSVSPLHHPVADPASLAPCAPAAPGADAATVLELRPDGRHVVSTAPRPPLGPNQLAWLDERFKLLGDGRRAVLLGDRPGPDAS